MSNLEIIFWSVIVLVLAIGVWANLTSDDDDWHEGTGEDDMY